MQIWSGPIALGIALGWLAFLAIAFFWPASYWFEVDSVRVLDSKTDEPIRMLVDRRIHREFHGNWSAQVRVQRLDGDQVVCPASGAQYYKRSSVLPTDVTLEWWTDGDCKTLPAGRYVVETVWTINPSHWPLPAKRVYVTSNPFEVKDDGQ